MAKKNFKVTLEDGSELELAIKTPSPDVTSKARIVYSKAFSNAVTQGCVVASMLVEKLDAQGYFSDERAEKQTKLQNQLQADANLLAKGGLKLSEGKKIALRMSQTRDDLQQLNRQWNQMESNTAEAIAEQARFNYLVSECTVYSKTGEKYFSSFEDYQSNDNGVAGEAAVQLSYINYGVEEDFLLKLPENQFLLKYKLVDSNLNFIDKDGNKVDSEGRRIDEFGNYLDDANQPIVEEVAVESAPFLDDDGNPVIVE